MLTIPLYDDNPTLRTPVVTIALIAACVLVFLWQLGLDARAEVAIAYSLGLVPAVFFGAADLPPELELVPPWTTLVTSMFLHGGLAHIGGNMLFLWIFGNNVEDTLGRARFILFYFLCGIAAALAQAISNPSSEIPMVGASGAIAGVLAAYLILHPYANVRVFVWFFIFVRLINVPAIVLIGLWFVMQVLGGLATPASTTGGVAFWAHVGGFLAGLALIMVLRPRGTRFWQPAHSRAFAVEPPAALRDRARFRSGSVPEAGQRRPRGW
ncbi:MAG: rhomboid family intramembrane serine protease [Rhodospirillales bacterium]|nr:rhomboid family intramembrane serine protease [Rhodospirillales bacterium]